MPVMRHLNVGGTTYDTVGEASVTQVLSSGTKIATVSIDGTATDLYAPAGGSSVDPATAAPSMDGTAAVGSSAKYAREDHVHPTDTSRAPNTAFTGATTVAAGSNGLVPAPAAGGIRVLASNGSWRSQEDVALAGIQQAVDGSSGYMFWDNGEGLLVDDAATVLSEIGAQAALVSGTNIKTVNGNSLLGSGDLTVSGSVSMEDTAVDAAVTAAFGIEVTVSLTNPISPSSFSSCSIMGASDGTVYPEHTTTLGTIDSPTGSTTVTFPSEYPYLVVLYNGLSVSSGTASCTGGVTYSSTPVSGYDVFSVSSSGTITIDGIDYND